MASLSIEQIRDSYISSPDAEFYKYSLARFFFRPISFYVAWLAIRLRMTPNQITFISWLALFVGCFNYATSYLGGGILSFSLILLWALLDYVDGTMARALKERSDFGHFIDVVGAYYLFAFFPICVAIGLDSNSDHGFSDFLQRFTQFQIPNIDIILVGAVAVISNLLLRLTLLRGQVTFDVNVRETNETSKLSVLVAWLEALLSPRGVFFPALLFCHLQNMLEFFLLFYAAYYAGALLLYTPLYCYKNRAN